MGKRKSSRKPMGPKRADPLPTSFSCLFCNHEKSVSVKLDKKVGTGSLECKVCGQRYQTPVNCIIDPILCPDIQTGSNRRSLRFEHIRALAHSSAKIRQVTNLRRAIDLSAEVDVYADWVDAAELAANSGEGPALGSLEDPRARRDARKHRDDGDGSDGGGGESPQYEGEGIVGDDIDD